MTTALVIKDPANPIAMWAKYDSGDHLHLSDAGYEAMAFRAAALIDKAQAATIFSSSRIG